MIADQAHDRVPLNPAGTARLANRDGRKSGAGRRLFGESPEAEVTEHIAAKIAEAAAQVKGH